MVLDDSKLLESVPTKTDKAGVTFSLPPNLKAGRYVVELHVNEATEVPVPGELVIADDETVKPIISELQTPVYPSSFGSLLARVASFTIVGDHFGSAADTQVEIAGHDPLKPSAVINACKADTPEPCIVVASTNIEVHGFTPREFEGRATSACGSGAWSRSRTCSLFRRSAWVCCASWPSWSRC